MGRRRPIGHENVPVTGPAIIAPNHASHVDPPFVATSLRRQNRTMAKIELFSAPILGPILPYVGGFPVKRGTADRTAIRTAIEHLAAGRLVVIFPEGRRGDGVNLQAPERGFAMIALKSGAPVIPTYISGTNKMLPRGAKRLRRHPIQIRFGPPIDPKLYTGKDANDALAKDVMAAIEALSHCGQSQPSP
jgi:1-acyl-sn-glycerol-3-phosphate acyltransferase